MRLCDGFTDPFGGYAAEFCVKVREKEYSQIGISIYILIINRKLSDSKLI